MSIPKTNLDAIFPPFYFPVLNHRIKQEPKSSKNVNNSKFVKHTSRASVDNDWRSSQRPIHASTHSGKRKRDDYKHITHNKRKKNDRDSTHH